MQNLLLNFATAKPESTHIDAVYTGNDVSRKKLVITCVDQTGDMIFIDNKQVPLYDFLESPLPVSDFFINRSPKAGALEPVNYNYP